MLLISIVYNICLPLFFIIYSPFYLRKQLKRGGLDQSFWERFGIFSKEKRLRLSKMNKPIWIHSVSVGETVAAINFIEYWKKQDKDIEIVLSTTTTTGQQLARKKSIENVEVIYMPIDFRGAIRRALKWVNPSKLIIFEVEIWPNLLIQAKKHDCEVILINGRMSDNSFRGFMRAGFFMRKIFRLFDKICVQTQEDAARYEAICADGMKATVCNTMKFDQAPVASSHIVREEIEKRFIAAEPMIFNAASTHQGEEEFILDLYSSLKIKYPQLVLMLVPRHVERVADIEKVIKERDLSYTLYSENSDVKCDVMLVNVTGELLSLISVSDFVFVGKSMCGNEGGHNIIEPAVFGKVVLHGKEMQNFRDVADIFKREEAAIVVDEANFYFELEKLILDKSYSAKLGEASRRVVEKYSGAMAKSLEIILRTK